MLCCTPAVGGLASGVERDGNRKKRARNGENEVEREDEREAERAEERESGGGGRTCVQAGEEEGQPKWLGWNRSARYISIHQHAVQVAPWET